MRAFIGIGSNIGDSKGCIDAAVNLLRIRPDIQFLRISSLYQSKAWGRTDQPDFINAVAEIETGLSAESLLAALLDIEAGLGRVRDTGRWGPRKIDLDLLCSAALVYSSPRLALPHPRMHERAFVLVPLLELEPRLVIPGVGPARDCLERLGNQAISPLPDI